MEDQYQKFKDVSHNLSKWSQNLPFPAGLALLTASRLILIITAFMEQKAIEQRQRDRAERLLLRGVDICNLILCHDHELRDDHTCHGFIHSFMTTMATIHDVLSKLTADIEKKQKGRRWSRVLGVGLNAAFGNAESQDYSNKQEFDELCRELDSLHIVFQSHLLSNKASKGPHQLIEHPGIQIFWKYQLTNALEVSWEHFWQHFLHVYPGLREIMSGESGHQLRSAFQSLGCSSSSSSSSSSSTTTTMRPRDMVGPEEINQIFQPSQESVERIVLHRLSYIQPGLPSSAISSAAQGLKILDIGSQGEFQHWKGFWVRGSIRGQMDIEIFVTKDMQVFGGGVDKIQRFTLEGEDLRAHVSWKKQYIYGHTVNYEGSKNGTKIQGVWSIGFSKNKDIGDFFLERVNNQTQIEMDNYEPTRFQTWTGFFVHQGLHFDMTTQLVFTRTCKMFGRGFDAVGHYTWLGTFYIRNGVKELDMIKQYYQGHFVHYKGILTKATSGEMVMKGEWSIPNNCEGTFELRTRLD